LPVAAATAALAAAAVADHARVGAIAAATVAVAIGATPGLVVGALGAAPTWPREGTDVACECGEEVLAAGFPLDRRAGDAVAALADPSILATPWVRLSLPVMWRSCGDDTAEEGRRLLSTSSAASACEVADGLST
jgi:hypothetical protein